MVYTPNLRFDRLGRAIKESTSERKIDFAVTVQCLPDIFAGPAITSGLVDYVWIEIFSGYNCYSEIGEVSEGILDQWEYWTKKASNTLFFLDLSAEPKEAFGYTYISPEALKSEILPTAKEASNYGGVMIRQRLEDIKYSYIGQIKNSVRKVCKCACDESVSTSFYGLHQRSLQNV
ncbi:hypothetical protein VNO77_44680 [Canavalia gladiata]|uniref:Uncharacterized protein n=1 Tax=Canavalia gladiata TaxID=3824 RepID=A0AAN9PP00_CANGL